MPRRLFRISADAPQWQKDMVARLDRELRDAYPELFGEGLRRMLMVGRGRGDLYRGYGTYVRRRAAMIPRGTVLGVYVGNIEDDTGGPYHLQLPGVTGPRRERWFPVVNGQLEVYQRKVYQAATYNHTCSRPTVASRTFGGGRLKCKLAIAARRLWPGDELTWNYGEQYVHRHGNLAELRREFPGAHACMCRNGRCPYNSVLIY